ncbi:hypothetical protein LTR37_003886 [Vermiconidia calcicola]|uniref:Uncharacterized protein n=1 Tax=Vermiconidia calcicola TaxID=1690605 RepID=A0ACC3NN63_9PEZI|nr:hypothetical protein LTR37_003886 [Vermiconidia calcicola]
MPPKQKKGPPKGQAVRKGIPNKVSTTTLSEQLRKVLAAQTETLERVKALEEANETLGEEKRTLEDRVTDLEFIRWLLQGGPKHEGTGQSSSS